MKIKDIIIEFNNFIKKWCGDSYSHLIDSDENDGERFRNKLKAFKENISSEVTNSQIQAQLPKKKEPSPYQSSDDYVRGWNDCLDEIRGKL